jgi:hypothetical protein
MAKNVIVEHRNEGTINKNSVLISTENGSVRLYFSYNTLVGVNGVISQNVWSNTTGKFLNELEPDKENRFSPDEVLKEAQKQLKKVLYTANERIVQEL